jgi:hypothetical protein
MRREITEGFASVPTSLVDGSREGLVVAAIIAAAVSIFVFTVGYVTEGRRGRRRRLDEEAVSAAVSFVAASSKRRRQLARWIPCRGDRR